MSKTTKEDVLAFVSTIIDRDPSILGQLDAWKQHVTRALEGASNQALEHAAVICEKVALGHGSPTGCAELIREFKTFAETQSESTPSTPEKP